MNQKPPRVGILNNNSLGTGPVTRGMIRERASELAVSNGHSAHDASKADWDQAKRELKSETVPDPKEIILEAAPESERWDPVPGSVEHQAPESLPEGEDAEGRSEIDQLVEKGIEVADSEQTLQAAIAANKQDRNES
jgi:hypothetical protein